MIKFWLPSCGSELDSHCIDSDDSAFMCHQIFQAVHKSLILLLSISLLPCTVMSSVPFYNCLDPMSFFWYLIFVFSIPSLIHEAPFPILSLIFLIPSTFHPSFQNLFHFFLSLCIHTKCLYYFNFHLFVCSIANLF